MLFVRILMSALFIAAMWTFTGWWYPFFDSNLWPAMHAWPDWAKALFLVVMFAGGIWAIWDHNRVQRRRSSN